MNNSLKKEAEYYIELYNTDRTGRTSVIKDTRDGSLWIRKKIERKSIEEYSRIRNLKHKNIVYIRDIVSLEGEIFVIEEYADGKTLESVLCEKRKFEEKEAAEIMLQICDGLIFLHKSGLTGGSILPSDILISCDGTVKLMNFDNSTFISSRFKQPDVSDDICACGKLFKKLISPAASLEGKGLSKAANRIIKRTEAKSYLQFRTASDMKNAFKKYGGARDKLSYVKSMIPGFRRGRLLNKIIALVVYAAAAYYIYAGLYQIIEHRDQTDISDGIFMIVFSLSMVIMPFFILADFLYYRERLPFIRRLNRPLKTAVGMILTLFAYFFIGLNISYYSRIFFYYLFKIS